MNKKKIILGALVLVVSILVGAKSLKATEVYMDTLNILQTSILNPWQYKLVMVHNNEEASGSYDLPPTAGNDGDILIIRLLHKETAYYGVTIMPHEGDTIEGQSDYGLMTDGEQKALTLVADADNDTWWIVSLR